MDASKWEVLIVEDEHDSAQVVSEILSHHGATLHVVNGGEECLAALIKISPTVIVMDLSMPEMDGWQTLMEIRANPDTAHIPVVAVTAYHSTNVAADAVAAGFNAYFPKPLDAATFVESVAGVIG